MELGWRLWDKKIVIMSSLHFIQDFYGRIVLWIFPEVFYYFTFTEYLNTYHHVIYGILTTSCIFQRTVNRIYSIKEIYHIKGKKILAWKLLSSVKTRIPSWVSCNGSQSNNENYCVKGVVAPEKPGSCIIRKFPAELLTWLLPSQTHQSLDHSM